MKYASDQPENAIKNDKSRYKLKPKNISQLLFHVIISLYYTDENKTSTRVINN